jgi:hypothetical protein
MSMFSLIRAGVTDLGNTTSPSWMCQRRITWAAVLPWRLPMSFSTGCCSSSPPWAIGLQDSVRMPWAWW